MNRKAFIPRALPFLSVLLLSVLGLTACGDVHLASSIPAPAAGPGSPDVKDTNKGQQPIPPVAPPIPPPPRLTEVRENKFWNLPQGIQVILIALDGNSIFKDKALPYLKQSLPLMLDDLLEKVGKGSSAIAIGVSDGRNTKMWVGDRNWTAAYAVIDAWLDSLEFGGPSVSPFKIFEGVARKVEEKAESEPVWMNYLYFSSRGFSDQAAQEKIMQDDYASFRNVISNSRNKVLSMDRTNVLFSMAERPYNERYLNPIFAGFHADISPFNLDGNGFQAHLMSQGEKFADAENRVLQSTGERIYYLKNKPVTKPRIYFGNGAFQIPDQSVGWDSSKKMVWIRHIPIELWGEEEIQVVYEIK